MLLFKERIKIFFYSVLLLFLLLSVKFSFLPMGIAKLFVSLGLMGMFFIVLRNLKLDKSLLHLIIYLMFIILFILNNSLFQTSQIDSFSYIFVLNIFEFILASFILVHIFKPYLIKDSYFILKIIVIAIFLHSLFIYLNVFIPSTRISETIIPMGGNIDEGSLGSLYRVRGLAFSANAGLSIMHCIGALIAYFLLDNTKIKKEKIIYGLLMFIILGATLFISRTGFFMFFLVLFLYLVFINFKTLLNNVKFLIMSLLLIGIFGGLIINLFVDIMLLEIILDKFLPWAFEIFIQNEKSSFLESRSTNDLLNNMIFFPDSEKTWFIGDGYYDGLNGSGHYVLSDSGYIRSLFAVGLVGTLFIYSFFIFIYFKFKKYFLYDKKLFYFLFLIVIVLLIVEIKMPLIFSGPIIKIIYIILFSQMFIYRSRNAI